MNEYEETLFLQDDVNRLVSIRKTELQGELYDQVRLGQQVISLPRPFVFVLRPQRGPETEEKVNGNGRAAAAASSAGQASGPVSL